MQTTFSACLLRYPCKSPSVSVDEQRPELRVLFVCTDLPTDNYVSVWSPLNPHILPRIRHAQTHYHGTESYEYVNSKELQFCSFVQNRLKYWKVRQRKHARVLVLSKLRQCELKQAQLQQNWMHESSLITHNTAFFILRVLTAQHGRKLECSATPLWEPPISQDSEPKIPAKSWLLY